MRKQGEMEAGDNALLGQAIRAARLSRANDPWTQGRLAREAGVNQSHLSKIERGEVDPTIGLTLHLLRVLGAHCLEFNIPASETFVDGRRLLPARFDEYGRRPGGPPRLGAYEGVLRAAKPAAGQARTCEEPPRQGCSPHTNRGGGKCSP